MFIRLLVTMLRLGQRDAWARTVFPRPSTYESDHRDLGHGVGQ